MNGWALVYEGFEPGQKKLREALCTVGNGYFCTRRAAPEAEADGIHYPGTYLAGGYNRRTTEIAGRQVENEDLVNFPNWLPLSFRIEEGEWFDLDAVDILSFRQELDLRCGVLHRTVRFQDCEQRISELRQRRLVHMCNRHPGDHLSRGTHQPVATKRFPNAASRPARRFHGPPASRNYGSITARPGVTSGTVSVSTSKKTTERNRCEPRQLRFHPPTPTKEEFGYPPRSSNPLPQKV